MGAWAPCWTRGFVGSSRCLAGVLEAEALAHETVAGNGHSVGVQWGLPQAWDKNHHVEANS